MDAPQIKVRRFEETLWVSFDDHKSEIQRYKDALDQSLKKESIKGSVDSIMDGFDKLFGKPKTRTP